MSLLFALLPHDLLPPRNVDDVHDIMDDLQEQNEIAEEIQNAISQPIGFGMDLDEVSVWECSPAQDVCCVEGPTYYCGYKRITVCVGGGVLSGLHPPVPSESGKYILTVGASSL